MNLLEYDSAVKIAIRERPLREVFRNNDIQSVVNYHSSNIIIVDERPFAFDHVFPPSLSQKELFDLLVMPLVGKFRMGFNCTALAYGQTGTGKSFTMGLNPESLEGVSVGMIPRCIEEILSNQNGDFDKSSKVEVSASFIEIYSEKLYDLLSENPSEAIVAKGYKFTGGTRKTISNIQDGYALINQGTRNRHVRPTKMNAQSSRSHAIFTIHERKEVNNKITYSCFNLVDLAGSEGVRRTGHQGIALSEGVHINQGLLSIGKVLQAITNGLKVIPYRDSVLSSVIQDSLNPNSYFTLLACISPHREDLSETLSTLRFAQSAKNLKHTPQINSKLMEIKKAKTPFKSIQRPISTPYKRPLSLFNSRTNGVPTPHGNTFCTPNKKKNLTSSKLNYTDMGLTPKEKQKVGSANVIKVNPYLHEPPLLDCDFSLASRSSPLNLNISSSTAIDGNPTSTFSPIVRRCMAEMENTMKSRICSILRETINHNYSKEKSSGDSILVEQNIRDIVRQQLLPLTEEKMTQNKSSRCELFRTISPIFKIPEVPVAPQATEQKIPAKQLRRSRRLSIKGKSLVSNDSVSTPKRRSTRLSSIENRRRSIRIISHNEESIQEEPDQPSISTSNSRKRRPTKKLGSLTKNANPLLDNSVIAGYFEQGKYTKSTNTKTALAKHQKAILEMLNSASMKELQYLPQIGLKTAFQIVTHRTLYGKFKSFAQISKLPIWRGNAWERFKMANNIS